MIQLDPAEVAKLSLCFEPQSAAIIGASTNPMKFGGRALKFCLERGYQGRLYPVNAKNDVVQGVPAFSSVADLPEAPDIAVIAVPAPQVKDNLIAAGQKGAKVAIVYGAQFAEAGEGGAARQDELLDIARSYGMRMIGPNCMGVMSMTSGFMASFSAAPEHHNGNGWPEVGTLSVASQSGAVGIQMFAQLRDRGIGLANWISTGNQADIDVADAIAYFATDPATRTIAVYMEDASRGLKLVQALECARAAGKPVMVLKVGTTPAGGVAAAGHTAAMYVEDRLVNDLFAQYGVLRAGSVNELIDLTAACNAGVMPRSNKVAAVSVSGGGAVMISDAAAQGGLDLPDYPADALAALKEQNGFVNDRNPIDISAPSMSNMAITGGHLKWGTERGQSTMLGYISHVPLVPRTRGDILPQLHDLPKGHPDQLIAIAGNFHAEDRKALVQSGLAVFDDPTVATRSVAKLVQTGRAFAKVAAYPNASEGQTTKDVRSALMDAGIEMVEEVEVGSVEDALSYLRAHGDIVLKLSANDLTHRTEMGGVKTGLAHPENVQRAFDALADVVRQNTATYPDLHIIAQPMLRGVEFLVGVRQDPHFGPLVVVGSGGTMCELFDDLTYRKAPIAGEEAETMVASTRVSRMLDGWRGARPVSRKTLLDTINALAVVAPNLPSLEINPLIVTETGAVGVDLVVAGGME
ncbi:MAG: acetate--CoA ligase family protein [Paracoccaceae bacterium]